ncbi:hypothetical protein [Streptomyces canus]|uniref:hypothetical protein n=1 Tax=Streptomyces canus TaxID=58343 RepID=UPI0038261EA9
MATARLSQAVAEAGGAITALDVAESTEDRLVVDSSCNAGDAGHSEAITKALAALPDCTVVKVSDQTFIADRVEPGELNANYIIPSVSAPAVAEAVRRVTTLGDTGSGSL